MIALLIASAWAVEPAVYAKRATLELPEDGPVLIELGEAAAWPNAQDLVLVDADGRMVPSLVLSSDQHTERRYANPGWWPGWDDAPPKTSTMFFDTREIGHPIDEILLGTGGLGSEWAEVFEVYDSKGRLVAEGLLWEARIAHEDRSNNRIEVPDLPPGVYSVRAERPIRWQGIAVGWGAELGVPTLELDLEVDEASREVPQSSVYRVELPGVGLEARELVLDVSDVRFDREVQVWTRRFDGQDLRYHHVGRGGVERLRIGGADIDHLVIPLDGPLGSELEIRIEDGRDASLDIRAVHLEAQGRRLLASEPGPGPHQLYAAPVLAQDGIHDLDHALIELLDADPVIVVVEWADNPSHNVADVIPKALVRAAEAQIRHHPFARRLEGPDPGLPTHWTLPQEVVISARSDLNDLRLVDADGHQVPYLLDSGPLSPIGTSVTRTEERGTTRLVVQFDEPAYIDHIELSTDSRAFSRSVAVQSGRGANWSAMPEDGAARLSLDHKKEAESLEIYIDNGDDLPLDELRVRAWTRSPSIVAVAPEGGATLYYGRPDVGRPDYDLQLYGALLIGGTIREGSVGPVQGHRVSDAGDRRIALGAVGALALALVFLCARLLRRDEEAAAG